MTSIQSSLSIIIVGVGIGLLILFNKTFIFSSTILLSNVVKARDPPRCQFAELYTRTIRDILFAACAVATALIIAYATEGDIDTQGTWNPHMLVLGTFVLRQITEDWNLKRAWIFSTLLYSMAWAYLAQINIYLWFPAFYTAVVQTGVLCVRVAFKYI